MAGHTPGPWIIGYKANVDGSKYTIRAAHRDIVQTIQQVASEEDKSNAYLIASAPGMLLSLQRIMHWIDTGCDPSYKSIEMARKAIAKSEGR